MDKKILCLIDSLGAGGAQRQLIGLATFLKECGYDVIVAIYLNDLFYADYLLKNGVPYTFLNKAENTLTRIYYISRYIRRCKPNCVISFLETPSICVSIAHIFNKRFRLIVSERNTTQHVGLNDIIRFNLFRSADMIVPNAYAQEDYIRKNFPFLTNKVTTIPNFVDLEHFHPKYHKRGNIPEILVVATIWAPKNTLGFIDAIEILAKSTKKFHISWYGKDIANIDYFNKCKQKIEEKQLDKYISLLEKTNLIAEHYRGADYFCLPSFYEGTPNVLCEAMASGLPIACSDVCDNSRYVTDGTNGFLFNPNNPNDIADKLLILLEMDDSSHLAFMESSRRIAVEQFSKEKFINSYLKLINE